MASKARNWIFKMLPESLALQWRAFRVPYFARVKQNRTDKLPCDYSILKDQPVNFKQKWWSLKENYCTFKEDAWIIEAKRWVCESFFLKLNFRWITLEAIFWSFRAQHFMMEDRNGNFEKNYHGGTKCTEVHRVNSLCESQCSPILRGKKTRLILSPVNPP